MLHSMEEEDEHFLQCILGIPVISEPAEGCWVGHTHEGARQKGAAVIHSRDFPCGLTEFWR